MTTPEQRAREVIDKKLAESGWVVQSRDEINLSAGPGVAVREFVLEPGHGHADYLLFVDGKAVGALEAKPEGYPLTSVEGQGAKYTAGLPYSISASAPVSPLPFVYLSTGSETKFANGLDPEPRSRSIFQFHRPETLRAWVEADTLPQWIHDWHPETGEYAHNPKRPSSLRARLQAMPPVLRGSLYDNQFRAVANLEKSLREDRPRSLIQMATGSGKTIMAITSIYRLIKYAGASRVLFLVDRKNLGEQAEKEFGNYRTPDDHRKFTELYNVQRLQSNTIGASSKVVISTIQRLYSMLQGEAELDPALEEESLWEKDGALSKEALPVVYNPAIPPEHFDVIFVDECHRSIYSLWRQVLDYFDAYLVGLTATPAAHTYGFFQRNLVMEYSHEEAVADNVNVDFEVYNIRTRITKEGATIRPGDYQLGIRDRQTRRVRWERPDEPLTYSANDLDRAVVAEDQLRTIIRTFRDKLPTEIFPGRREVPKTLIFAKDDSHAEDIVKIVREEFGKGNDFCQKITYKSTDKKPSDLIQEFRVSYNPRIAVTVDMIATGTDIKPIEIVMFMRSVQSRVHFEQMKGRGVRVVDQTTLQGVTPEAQAKTHFVIVDCVGVTEGPLSDTQPLERKKTISFDALLEHVALGGTDPDYLSSLAARLARLDRQCGDEEKKRISDAAGGTRLADIVHGIVRALDPDEQAAVARIAQSLPEDVEPKPADVDAAAKTLLMEAAAPLATKPALRQLLIATKRSFEQIIDDVSLDELLEAGTSEEARDKARALVRSFEQFLAEKKGEIEALEFFYSQPYKRRISFADIKALHAAIKAPPRLLTPERLWAAYKLLEQNKVRGASSQRKLADIVSLVRFALHQEPELVPYADGVQVRFEHWMATQELGGRSFTVEQRRWLEMIRDHIAQSLEITPDDFGYAPFVEEGGLGKARQVLGPDLTKLMDELNGALVS
ncbi:MAG: DEAD/DEAH box helicase family protein [Thermotogota bacterium]